MCVYVSQLFVEFINNNNHPADRYFLYLFLSIMTFVNDKNTVAILNAAAGISLRRLIVAYSLVDIIVVVTRGDSRCNHRHLSSPVNCCVFALTHLFCILS